MSAQSINQLPIDQIRPYEKNPRINKDSIPTVAESIRRFGFQQPIIVDREGVIVVGHTRYAAAKKLKLKTVPVKEARHEDGTWLTDDECKAYRIADNKVGEKSQWDVELLREEVSELASINFDIGLLGEVPLPDLADLASEHKRPDFQTEPGSAVAKDENWLFIEFYGNPARYEAIKALLGENVKGLHQVDADYFEKLVKGK